MPRNPNCSCCACGTEIYRRPSQINGNVFCSSLCVGKFQTLNQKECPVCGKSFVGHKKNCSRSCSNKSRFGIKYDGINSRNKATKGKKLKENLSKTRSGICEECGNNNYNILQVHHIIERCNGGTDDEINLQLLCPNCHYTKHLGYSIYGR
jgi:5-methylcytosine-specific restriction endonuclease McrA